MYGPCILCSAEGHISLPLNNSRVSPLVGTDSAVLCCFVGGVDSE